ncbi:hypothetical protein [Sphingomonas endophytica]|uniref:Integrase n=1 Tax=Sphingomonas endophytica TaxID=869719 RepID=A0A147HVU6_9SPHN|nr:hypothetical protein [Sphingomonas endophytica]KTT68976.1 hypothetical protein NS334_15525 [Sphingomonas endophytica]
MTELEMSTGREWRPYLLRHSLATLVRNRGATRCDLEGFRGQNRALRSLAAFDQSPMIEMDEAMVTLS